MADAPLPLAQQVRRVFADAFGDGGARVFFAPGRVNIIGAHLDYSGGDVLPLAVDRGIYVAARLRRDGRLRLRSLDQPLAVDVDAGGLQGAGDRAHGWANYPLGVWWFFAQATRLRAGADLVFGGDLPMASGLSSSAAIEVATATALDLLHGTKLPPVELAMLCHRAENEYVGLKCGIMDQFASALGRAGHLLLLHCASRAYEHVPIGAGAFEVLVLDTRKARTLASTGFNQRVRECAEAHAILRRHVRDLPFLAAYTEADLERAGDALAGVHRKRAMHVVTEMGRVAAGVRSLRAGDMRGLGRALNESHRSARDDYEVSCEELDVITAAAREMDAVHGARLTGAGFGGCGIALVQRGRAGEVMTHVRSRYRERFALDPAFYLLHAGSGPREVD
jgi:galactokinase